jgi:hypothetical protein
VFREVIAQTLLSSLNYISDYCIKIQLLVLFLSTHTFAREENNQIVLEQRSGDAVNTILPENLPSVSQLTNFPPPIDKDCISDQALEKQFSKLSNTGHLQKVHSTYFGPLSPRAGAPVNQFQQPFTEFFPATLKSTFATNPYAMKTAMSRYATNFKNMWGNKNRFRNTLYKIITVLLRLHLSPFRERKKWERVESNRKNTAPKSHDNNTTDEKRPTIIDKSFKERRRLFRDEQKRRETYIRQSNINTDEAK